jgi:hypothetical protein
MPRFPLYEPLAAAVVAVIAVVALVAAIIMGGILGQLVALKLWWP